MNKLRMNKSPAKSPRISNTNDDKPTTSGTTYTSGERNGPSTSSASIQPYKMEKSDIFVPKTTKHTHVGSKSIVKEAICLESITRKNIANINDTCQNCERESKDKSFTGKLQKFKKNWTYGKCYLLAIVIILIQILLMAFLYNTNTKENEVRFIDLKRINWMHNGLDGFWLRNNWTLFKDSNDCSYECPKLKSKIRFFNLSPNLIYCTNMLFDISAWDGYLSSVMRGSEDGYVRETYYNYIIYGINNVILQGRPLTCPHDEPFLKEDHSNMIIVGIYYGANTTGETGMDDAVKSLKVTDVISDLLTNLREMKMLTKDYVLEFQHTWNSSLLIQRLRRVPDIGRMSFYEYGLHKNFDPLNLPEKANFLTDEKLSRQNFTTLDLGLVMFPPVLNPDSNISLIITHNLTYLITVIYERRNLDFCDRPSAEEEEEECSSIQKGYYKEWIPQEENSVGSYFLYSHRRRISRLMPPNYPRNIIDNKFFVNIFLIHDSYNGSSVYNEEILVWYYNAFLSVRSDIRERVEYTIEFYQPLCDFKAFECLN